MDDRDLEVRLRTHLHRRFDDAEPPRELRASHEQAFATQPRLLGLFDLRSRAPMHVGFSLTAVALVLVVLATAATNLGLRFGPAGNGPTPSPTAAPSERTFMVLPPTPDVAPKPDSIAATDVLSARLRALGIGTFSSGGGFAIAFTIPGAGPSDADISAVLAAPGVVEFVPIPAGQSEVVAGQPLPAQLPVLFGSGGVASVRDGSDQNGNAALDVNLTPAAAELFGAYTTDHVGEQLAIVLDGRVVTAPIIQSAITGGQVQITNASSGAGFALEATTRAILIGGELPVAWRAAPVVQLIPEAQARAIAVREAGTVASIVSADPQPLLLGIGRWTAVWNVVLAGEFPVVCGPGPTEPPHLSSCPPPASTELIVLDGATGGFIQREAPAP